MEDKNKDFGELKSKSKLRPTIGLLLENTVGKGGYQADVWSGVANAVRERGANLISFAGGTLGNSYPNEFENTQNVVYDLASINNVDGLIISGTLGTFITQEEFRNFIERFKPLPIVSTIMSLPSIPSVLVDNEKGMREILIHLIEHHKYRKIAFICGPQNNPDARQRYQVYKAVLFEQGIPFDENLVVTGDFLLSSGASALDDLLKKAKPDVVVAANDNMALGALEALRGRGINVPHELAVVGFDNMRGARDVIPSLTTVYYPAYEQGKKAVEMLLALLSGKKTRDHVTLSTELRRRESCGCPNPLVEQAKAGLIIKANTTIKTDLTVSQENILADVQEKAPDLSIGIGNGRIKELIGAFYAELEGKSTKGFLTIFDEILGQVAMMDGNIPGWYIAVSCMRCNIIPLISEDSRLFRAEDLWQQAQVMIGERALQAQGYRKSQAEQRAATLSSINQALITSSNEIELMKVLEKGLPHLGIPDCYVSLYENPVAPTNGCRSILAYQDGCRLKLTSEKRRFPFGQLLPDDVLQKDRSYNLIVEPLYFHENQQGIAVFEIGPKDEAVYQRLRGQLSSALRGTAIAQENTRRMKELEHLQDASKKIASVADMRDVLQQIAESAHEVLEADSVAIWSYDASRKTFLPDELVTHGIPEDLVEKSKLDKPSLRGTAAAIIRKGYLAVTDVDYATYKYLGPQAHRLRGEIGVKSFQGIALKVGNEVLGVLYVNYKVSQGFDDEDESTLKVFAHHAALALKKARLLKQVSRVSETARVVAEISAQEDLQSTLKAIAEGTRHAFGCDVVTLNSYNPVTSELGYPPAMSGVKYPERVQSSKGKLEADSILYKMLQQEKLYIVMDIAAQNPDFRDLRFVKEEGIQSCVAIRLVAAHEKVGVMFVNYRSQHHFTGQEIEDIKLFANQAAVAIRNKQLYDQATNKAKYLHALYEAGKTVAGTLALEEILKSIVEQAWRLAARQGQKPIFCYLAQKENNKLKVKVAYSARRQAPYLVPKMTVIDLENDQRIRIIGRTAKTGKSQLVLDVTKDPDYIPDKKETKSVLAVPICIGEDVLGVIAVGHSNDGIFNEEDRDCLELLSTQAALAIRNAKWHEEKTTKATHLQALYGAGKIVTSTLALGEILEHIVEQASLLTAQKGQQAHFCYLALHENGKLSFKAAYPPDYQSKLTAAGYVIDLEHDKPIGIIGRAVIEGKSFPVGDVTKDVDYRVANPETRSELAVPIKIGEDVIGVIGVEHSSYDAFDWEDAQALEALADQAAIAIRNARQYDDLEQIKGMVGSYTALDWMRMVSTVWGHSIKREVGKTLTSAELVRRACQKGNHPEALKELEDLYRIVEEIGKIPITAPLSAEDQVSSVRINPIVQGYLQNQWKHARYKPVELVTKLQSDLDGWGTVRASEAWLRRGLEIAVENAVQAMLEANSSQKQLSVTTNLVDNKVEILISDTGPGIPLEIQKLIFKVPIEKPKGSKGAGVGCALAGNIFGAYQGSIAVRETGPSGTIIAIILPIEGSSQ